MATLIGITGQIGSGKSTAANVFAKFGAAIINADQIGREVVEKNKLLIRKLQNAFGTDIVDSNGNLKRKRVAVIAFSSSTNKKKLDKLVHPYLLEELRSKIKRLSKSKKVIVIDAALLLDWHLDKVLDKVLLIHSNESSRISRHIKQGFSKSDIKSRQKWQMNYAQMKKLSDMTILNNSSKAEFESKVKDWAIQFFN
jgi:dephospho-CoA kinase